MNDNGIKGILIELYTLYGCEEKMNKLMGKYHIKHMDALAHEVVHIGKITKDEEWIEMIEEVNKRRILDM